MEMNKSRVPTLQKKIPSAFKTPGITGNVHFFCFFCVKGTDWNAHQGLLQLTEDRGGGKYVESTKEKSQLSRHGQAKSHNLARDLCFENRVWEAGRGVETPMGL